MQTNLVLFFGLLLQYAGFGVLAFYDSRHRNTTELEISMRAVADFAMCPPKGSVFINVGGKNLGNGYRCDIGNFVSGKSIAFETTSPPNLLGACTKQYASHRWAPTGDVTYNIPVPNGSYKVFLGFMEIFKGAKLGFRKFTIYINDKKVTARGVDIPLDILSKVSIDEPYFVDCGHWPSVNGKIKIELDRFFNGNNPMLSALGIVGPGADKLIGNQGLNSCDPNEKIASETQPVEKEATNGNKEKVKPPALVEPKVPAGKKPSKVTEEGPIITQPDKSMSCPSSGNVFINAGGSNLEDGFRCDTGSLASKPSMKFSSSEANVFLGKCEKALLSHRFATGDADLLYNIPVPGGAYQVNLMFAEVWKAAKKGTRQFTVHINGNEAFKGKLDVFSMVGHNKVFSIEAEKVVPKNNFIEIKLGRVPGGNNPFISAISIIGKGANGLIKDLGLKSCANVPLPTPNSAEKAPDDTKIPSKEECSENSGPITTNFADFHLAHAVAGGPYVETDFKKQGKVAVLLDGERSHSHATDPSVGVITSYKWTWKDSTNPDAVNGIVTAMGAKPKPPPLFPLGLTEVQLEVADQFCNRAKESTIVTINPSTKPGAFCYYYDFKNKKLSKIPITENIKAGQRPEFGAVVGDISFSDTKSFGDFKFNKNTFAVRCVFSIFVEKTREITYQVEHSGPVKVFYNNVPVATSKSNKAGQTTTLRELLFSAGLHNWQIIYSRHINTAGSLKFKLKGGGAVPSRTVRHDAAAILPIITSISKTTALPGEFVSIFGSSFVNDVVVKFGTVVGAPVESSAGTIVLRAPNNSKKKVEITVQTEAGVSNGVLFQYGEEREPCENLQFKKDNLKTPSGGIFKLKDIAVLRYGPDGRMYLGSQRSKIHALTIDQNLKVTKTCTKNVAEGGLRRWILGIAFDPHVKDLKMYFSSNTFSWKKLGLIKDFGKGWTNGKIQSVTLNNEKSCFNNDLKTVVSGLPVSNHDHGVNFIDFLPNGRILIAVGGFTNGGVTHPKDALGGIPPAPYAGALISCPNTNTGSKITYSNLQEPDKAEVTGGGCTIFAPGLRNSFAGTQHTNGEIYVTDNGPNLGFGSFSMDCNGGSISAANVPDKLFKIHAGKCHGHPHIPRGKAGDPAQCVFSNPKCVKPLLDSLTSSTNGVLEYRSNLFAQKLKSDLLLARFSDSTGKKGQISRVQLDANGNVVQNGVTNFFSDDSGLSIVEGPRGEIICSRVFKDTFFVLSPTCSGDDVFTSPYLIGVHPKRGPATGGQRVLVSGFSFGTAPAATFGGKQCAQVKVVNDKAFSCTVPKGKANSKVPVVVTTASGRSQISGKDSKGSDYWYW